MLLEELQKRWDSKYLKFSTRDTGIATVSLSDKSEVNQDFATIYVEITEVSKDSGEITSVVPIGMPPVRQAGGMVRLGNTFYTLMSGLIQRDGFYLAQDAKSVSLQFIRNDKLLFKFVYSGKAIKFSLLGGNLTTMDTHTFLTGIGVFNSVDEYNFHMAGIKRFFYQSNKPINKEHTSKNLFFSMYGPENTDNFSALLHEKTFNGFFGTAKEYKGKKVFFSYSRFIGNELISCSDSNVPESSVIDEELALTLDRLQVTDAVISFNGKTKEKINVDWSTSLTTQDIINALNILVLSIKYEDKVALCDMYAIYNKTVYNYYDYVADYLYDRTTDFIRKSKSISAFSGNSRDTLNELDFNKWLSSNFEQGDSKEKGKAITSVNNSVTFYMNRFKFTKDLLRKDIDSIPDGERFFNQSYFGWVNPFITSDSAKVGLTGSFLESVDVTNLSRPFTVISSYVLADSTTDNEEEETSEELALNVAKLESVDTFDKVIGFLEKDKTYSTMLNGKLLPEWDKSTWDMYCDVGDLSDMVTDMVPGLECEQTKRYRLSNKTIIQSMPMVQGVNNARVGMKSSHEDDLIGKTAEDIVKELAEVHKAVSKQLLTRKEALIRSLKVNSVVVGRYKNNAERSYDDNQEDTYHMTLLLDGVEYVYRHPRYIQSPLENSRLYFSIQRPKNGSYYESREVVITSGRVGDVGQECNVLYGCLDGYTYEDGFLITTKFVNAMKLTTKLHFSMTIPFEGELTYVNLHKDLPPYLDEKGLPKINTFIRKGDLLCKIKAANIVEEYSQFSGFVESIKINSSPYKESKKEVKIYLCEISTPRVGDKFGNGHGNKGVCVRVIDSESICVNGDRQPDIIINPLGTIGRMNFGQLKEMLENVISENSNERLLMEQTQFDQMDIKKIVQGMQDNGIYNENSIVYNGVLLKNKGFVAPLVMYRMKQHSRTHIKYTSRPNPNVNHIASEGQRMSSLNMLLYTAYGCQDALKYLLSYQSREVLNSSTAEDDLLNGNSSKPAVVEDNSVLRVNAMHMARGQRLTDKGPSYLTCDDVANLEVLSDNPTAIISENVFGKADTGNPSGYQLVAKLQVGGSVIMPSILNVICNVIPVRYMHGGANSAQVLTDRIIESICKYADNKVYIKINDEHSCIHLFEGIPTQAGMAKSNYGQGYFALIDAINSLDMSKAREHLTEEQVSLLHKIEKECGFNFIQKLTLDGVPVAPVNLRPVYRGRSGQGVDSLYRTLSRATSPTAVYNALLSIDKEFRIQLYQHSAVKPKRGEIAHSEKTSEYIDSIYARRYGYSGRSVATFDTSLEIFEISLPFELVYYELERMVKERMYLDAKEYYSGDDDSYVLKKELFNSVDEAVKNYVADLTYDKGLMYTIMSTLEMLVKNLATGMTREPVLRRQNHFWYKIKFHKGSSIKNHPAICSGYNLDFDGDATSNFMCLSPYYSNELISKMSPFEGIYDYDSEEMWLKPVQDSLLGLYKITKYAPSEEVQKVYVLTDDTLTFIKNDVSAGRIKYGDTVIVMRSQTMFVKQTVGNVILLLTLRKDALVDNNYCVQGILDIVSGGMTNKTTGKFIEKLLNTKELYDDSYHQDEMFERFEFEKFKIMHVIRDVINLGYEVITGEGVTLNPSLFAEIKTARELDTVDNTTKEFKEKTSVMSRLNSKVQPLFTLSTLSKSKKDIQDLIRNSVYENVELSDIFKSGCRGKIDDFLKVCDSIGKNVYEGEERNIGSNYSKGLTFMDKMLLAQPDRKAVVNTQVHLGEQGAKLKRSATVAASSRVVTTRCDAKPVDMKLEYDLYVDGMLLTERSFMKTEDENVISHLSMVIPGNNVEKKSGYSTELLRKVMVKYSIREIDGKSVEYRLKEIDKRIIKSHYVVLNGKELKGPDALKLIEEELPKDIGIYTLYNCVAKDGICKHCYGLVTNEDVIKNFSGNVGVNTVFSVGQQAFQNTLDASKSTSGDMSTQSQSILSLFKKGDLERLSNGILVDGMTISYTKERNAFKVTGSDGNSVTCSPAEFDVYYEEHEGFMPKRFINFINLLGKVTNDSLEYHYMNMIRLLCTTVTPQQADTILSINMRFVNNDGTEPINHLNSSLPRHWLTEGELYLMQDPMVSPLLPEPYKKFILDALTGKRYNTKGIFYGVFSLDKVDELVHKTSVRARKRDILKRSQLTGSTVKPAEIEAQVVEQKKDNQYLTEMAIMEKIMPEFEKTEEEYAFVKTDYGNVELTNENWG